MLLLIAMEPAAAVLDYRVIGVKQRHSVIILQPTGRGQRRDDSGGRLSSSLSKKEEENSTAAERTRRAQSHARTIAAMTAEDGAADSSGGSTQSLHSERTGLRHAAHRLYLGRARARELVVSS